MIMRAYPWAKWLKAPGRPANGDQPDGLAGSSLDRPSDKAATPAGQSPALSAVEVQDLLLPHRPLLDRIKLCFGADKAAFEADVLPLIARYAHFVQALPATPANYFSQPGGLLHLGLEVAFVALQGTDGHIFCGRATITARKQLEPRWRLATFIAGLCGQMHVALGRLQVVDTQGQAWPAYLEPLSTWLHSRQAGSCHVRWLTASGDQRALNLFALRHVVLPQTLHYLAAGDSAVVPHLLASVSGMPVARPEGDHHNVLDDLVKRAFALVVERDLQARAERLGRPELGEHVAGYLVDAMRRLVAAGAAWTPNAERSRLWWGADGLFMVWPNAADDICKVLDDAQIPGFPKASTTLAGLLIQAKVVVPTLGGRSLWVISPGPGRPLLQALKLAHPDLLLAAQGVVATPLALRLAQPGQSSSDAGACRGDGDGDGQEPQTPGDAATADQAQVFSGDGEASLGSAPADGLPPAATEEPAAGPTEAMGGQAPVEDRAASAVLGDSRPQGEAGSGAEGIALSLNAPLRLNRAVREALVLLIQAIDPVCLSSGSGARLTPLGLLVPLQYFESRGVEPAAALRALGEVDMLHLSGPARARTVELESDGRRALGLVVRAAFIKGLGEALAAARPTPSADGSPVA